VFALQILNALGQWRDFVDDETGVWAQFIQPLLQGLLDLWDARVKASWGCLFRCCAGATDRANLLKAEKIVQEWCDKKLAPTQRQPQDWMKAAFELRVKAAKSVVETCLQGLLDPWAKGARSWFDAATVPEKREAAGMTPEVLSQLVQIPDRAGLLVETFNWSVTEVCHVVLGAFMSCSAALLPRWSRHPC
jgi:hypothetical protein